MINIRYARVMMGIWHLQISWKAMISTRVTMLLNFLSTSLHWFSILILVRMMIMMNTINPLSSDPQGDQSGEATSCRLCSAQMSNQSKRQNTTNKRTVCDGFETEWVTHNRSPWSPTSPSWLASYQRSWRRAKELHVMRVFLFFCNL